MNISKPTCIDIEIAILKKFDFRKNLIVPNITTITGLLPFETDMLIITPSNMAYGFEIKVSKSDLKNDFKKKQHINLNKTIRSKSGLERYFGRFKYFYYAIPEDLKEEALSLIPDFCGLWCLRRTIKGTQILDYFYEVRKPKRLFNTKWTEKERSKVAHLGCMRIYNLKLKNTF